jgi:7-keto-8-aminopelargonate synthetase-like enzyme
VAAVYSGIDLVELAVTQRDKLLVRTKMVQNAVRAQGWSVVSDDDVPIVAIWCDTLAKAREVQEGLAQRGSVVEALAARGLRKNGAVVRAVLSSGHTDLEVSRLLDGLLEIRKRLAT